MFVDGLPSSHLAYRLVNKDQTRLLAAFEKLPAYKREVEHFKAGIAKVTSVDALLKDRRALTVALSAFQLESEIDKTALIRKIITEDPAGDRALVKRLADPRWENFAKAFHSLALDGGTSIRKKESVDAILAGFRTNEFEKAMGEGHEAVREAMFFKRLAPNLKTIPQVLSNKVSARVVREALGLPLAFGALDVQQQIAMLKSKGFDPAKLAEPKFLDRFIDRFLTSVDRQTSAATVNPVVALLQPAASGSSPGGINILA